MSMKQAELGTTIDWTPEKFARFKRLYANALVDDKETLVFDGHGFLTIYAKYLIQCLATYFPQ